MKKSRCEGVLQADEFLKLAPQPTAPLPAAAAEDWALLLYSSGTTGQPKGVVHTHANLGAAVRSLADCWAFAPDDVLVNVLPFFHIHGISFASHVNFLTGAHMLMADQFHPDPHAGPHRPRHGLHGHSAHVLSVSRDARSFARTPKSGRTCGSSPAGLRPSAPKCCRNWKVF